MHKIFLMIINSNFLIEIEYDRQKHDKNKFSGFRNR